MDNYIGGWVMQMFKMLPSSANASQCHSICIHEIQKLSFESFCSVFYQLFFFLWIMFILLPPSRAFSIYRREIKKRDKLLQKKMVDFIWKFSLFGGALMVDITVGAEACCEECR